MKHLIILATAAWLFGFASTATAQIKLQKIEAVHGSLGPPRATLELYPNEELVFRYQIAGAQVDEEGQIDVVATITVRDKAKKTLFTQATPIKGVLALGGASFPSTANVQFNDQVAAGEYQVEVSVKDNANGDEVNFRRPITLKKAVFAIVNPRFFFDRDGNTAAPVGGVVSQTLFFRLQVIGFDRSKKRIDVEMNVQVLDREGQPVMPKPIHAELVNKDPDVVQEAPLVTFNGEMALNQAGEYTLEIVVTDRSSKKEVVFQAPLAVAAP